VVERRGRCDLLSDFDRQSTRVSELPASALRYETVVAEYFLGLRGSGLMLSPLDVEQVRAWERRGLPVAVVCRGLRRGLDAALRDRPPGSPAPRSLRAYRLAVEDEWRAYRHGRVGDAPAPPAEEEVAARRLVAAGDLVRSAAAAALGARRDAYLAAARALAAVGDAPSLADVDTALDAADAAAVRAWVAALAAPERAALGPRCRLRAGDRPAAMRRATYRDSLRAHLLDAAREAGLLCLRGSV
jgi:hypothetical protein